VVHLPVTTAIANRAGREIWGYNKFVAAIDVSREGKTFSTVLRDSDHDIIGALEGARRRLDSSAVDRHSELQSASRPVNKNGH
jgi:hypothetical protein